MSKRRRHFPRSAKDLPPPRRNVYVIPMKNGLWRTCMMTDARNRRWTKAWRTWYDKKGHRLAISPEMWVEK